MAKSTDAPQSQPLARMIPMNQIVVREDHARAISENDEALKTLIDDIKRHGLLEPIIVQHIGNDQFLLVAGLRRYVACKALGYSEILACHTEHHAQLISLKENIEREDLTALQKSACLITLQGQMEFDNLQKIADMVGRTPSWVSQLTSLRKLPEYIKRAAHNDKRFGINFLYRLTRMDDHKALKAFCKVQKQLEEKGKRKDRSQSSAGHVNDEAPELREKRIKRTLAFFERNKEDREMLKAMYEKLSQLLGLSGNGQGLSTES